MKRVMMIAVFALLSVCVFAQTVGEKVYKEVSVNGEKLSERMLAKHGSAHSTLHIMPPLFLRSCLDY